MIQPNQVLKIQDGDKERREKKIREFCEYLDDNGYCYTITKEEIKVLESYTSDRVGI